jgi:isopentenyl-diphosphate delta-isomerase
VSAIYISYRFLTVFVHKNNFTTMQGVNTQEHRIMSKVAPITERKDDHVKINLERDVNSALTTGLENYSFFHEALPDIDLEQVDTGFTLFNKILEAPILVSSMTGGTQSASVINMRLAEAAQKTGIAMGVGSQRAALEHSEQAETFQVRKVAPDILLFANIGAIQLNYGYGLEQCQRAVDMIAADALYLHLNPLQEALQAGGDTNWKGLDKKIEKICSKIKVPIIVKEVGWGISEKTARRLADCGVSAIDVAGAGGTSWSQVEMYRAPDDFLRRLAATFVSWGIPTAESIQNVKRGAPNVHVLASGGIKDGLDIAKCLALGAALGGMAGQFLKAAAVSTENVIEMIQLTQRQLQVTMFAAGAGNIKTLQGLALRERNIFKKP